ncbi:ribonuclease H2 subunit C-like isoform X1 [Ptychodera flava]|uniref:ribonuclease H2 subunit C-like isoform X1 n=1 Tax=Ptychodera flava TaxID=63121 RepID=UPI00396A299E
MVTATMSIYIDRHSLDRAASDSVRMSYIPCKIEHNGEAKVNEYFRNSIRDLGQEKGETMSASIRGRSLHGINVDVPEEFTGLVIKEDKKPFLEDEDRHFKVVHRFQRFEYWNWDKEPSVNDKLNKVMVWPTIAAAIHSPVSTDNNLQDSQGSVAGKR